MNPHTISDCKSKISCIAKGCQKRHHTLLHLPPVNKISPVSPQSSDFSATINNETPENNIQLQFSSHSIQNKTQALLQKVPITLISNSCCLDTNALLDSGSDITLIHKDIVKNLGLKGEKREISVSGATLQTEKIKSGLINVNIISEDSSNQIQLSAWSVKDLDIPEINYDMNAIKRKYHHLQDIEFPKVKSDKVTVLIGINHADLSRL